MARNLLNIIIITIAPKKKKTLVHNLIYIYIYKIKHWQKTFSFYGDDIIPKAYFSKKQKQNKTNLTLVHDILW